MFSPFFRQLNKLQINLIVQCLFKDMLSTFSNINVSGILTLTVMIIVTSNSN